MRTRGRQRAFGRGKASTIGSVDLPHMILRITSGGELGEDLTVYCAAPHGLTNESVIFSGTSVAAYNGQEAGMTVQDAYSFITTGVVYTTDAIGGTWRLA